MKLKGLTKLALSGVALAAVAATLGTSTYAWYVSNSTANVNGLNGSTAASEAGSLLVNTLKINEVTDGNTTTRNIVDTGMTWTNKINVSLKGQPSDGLSPVTKDGDGFTPKTGTGNATGWHDVSKTPIQTNNAVGYFMFGAWSTKETHADIVVGIKNTTASVNNSLQTAYNSTGLPDNVNVDDQFAVDFVYALKFDVQVITLAGATDSIIYNAAFTTSYKGETAKQRDNFSADYATSSATSAASLVNPTSGNAHNYYKALTDENTTTTTGANPAKTIDGGESETSSSFAGLRIELGANVKKIVLIRYWLDGADTDCFDSCKAQSFDLSLQLTAVTPA